LLLCMSCSTGTNTELTPKLRISENKRFLATETGDPFFWLGDTGWMLFTKLNREEAEKYFEDRRQKGFNVIQVMVLQNVRKAVNVYGDSALINHDIARPLTSAGNSPDDTAQYDYWDHVDYLINLAQKKGLYMALVPVWGSNVRNGSVTREKAGKYAAWLARRYKDKPNVIWINGGDINGSDSTAIWKTIGSIIRQTSPGQLITFHPFGRTQSSKWFHNETWLDFNMFQSGHRRYDQDTLGLCYGEDNWKYAVNDYGKIPIKPTMDGEPSYEGIPQGLHDPTQPYWTDADVRRYAYWSVFAGGCGFTYGNNAIMQFHKEGDPEPAYGVKDNWDVALNAPGASQMRYLKQLMMSRSYFERIPAQDLLADKQGEKYDYLAATRGKDYAFIYTCNGSTMNINLGKMHWTRLKASWFNPRNGTITKTGTYKAQAIKAFDPPGEKANGNDWVLILDRI
ncbi:MAG: glycoside hydrolase family 140 protein, partial [Bacteroidales bacterium]